MHPHLPQAGPQGGSPHPLPHCGSLGWMLGTPRRPGLAQGWVEALPEGAGLALCLRRERLCREGAGGRPGRAEEQ